MSEQPSYRTSTLSQAFILTILFYCATILLVTAGLIWANLNAETAKLIIGWTSALQSAITSAYLAVRGMNGTKPPEAPKP